MVTDYERKYGGFPLRRPQRGPGPSEGDEFFDELMNSPDTIREQQEARQSRARRARRSYDGFKGWEDGEAD
jgi:hypothetical protein